MSFDQLSVEGARAMRRRAETERRVQALELNAAARQEFAMRQAQMPSEATLARIRLRGYPRNAEEAAQLLAWQQNNGGHGYDAPEPIRYQAPHPLRPQTNVSVEGIFAEAEARSRASDVFEAPSPLHEWRQPQNQPLHRSPPPAQPDCSVLRRQGTRIIAEQEVAWQMATRDRVAREKAAAVAAPQPQQQPAPAERG